ncbi:MAG TPA: alkaline phosphatase family protein [Longimicrobium sp.]|nr:alkaline phosphatase family protein [Longimicrobium sp.]
MPADPDHHEPGPLLLGMGRRILLALLVLAAVAGAAALVLEYTGNAPEEVAELLGEGSEKTLRDPMRPARGGARVLVFALDGVGDDELRAALRSGRMPRTSALLGRETGARAGMYEHAYAAPGVLSILPSTTYAAWTSLFTGEPAGRTGVPGNEWFVREEMRFYAPAPVSVTQHEHALEVYTDQLMGRVVRVPTLYERADVRSYVSLHALHRGADLLTVPEPRSYSRIVREAAAGLADPDERPGQEAYEELDGAAAESLVRSIRRRGIADLQVVYFPGVDLYTHVAADPLADQLRYLGEVVDGAVGELLEAYRDAGAMDSTYVLFVADHGHTPVLRDDRHALEAEGADEPPEVLRRAGFRVRPFDIELRAEQQDYQAVVAYQGAFAYVYLADRSTCPRPRDRCDWTRPPRQEQDVLPAVRAFAAASATGQGVSALRGALDLVLARPHWGTPGNALPFGVWDGRRLAPVGEYLAAHPRPELLDLERRLAGLGTGPFGHRAGDVLLLARTGAEVPIEQRFYFSVAQTSWHGSPSDQDSRIPLLLAHPRQTGAALRARVAGAVGAQPSQLSITPLILRLLGRPAGS